MMKLQSVLCVTTNLISYEENIIVVCVVEFYAVNVVKKRFVKTFMLLNLSLTLSFSFSDLTYIIVSLILTTNSKIY
jgi:hypothetical protein